MEDLLKQAYNSFADLISKGMCILPPDRNFLFYEQYDFSNLNKKHRDKESGLVGLWQSDTPIPIGYPKCDNDQMMTIDFGDSAHKTGHLAFCNSEIDKKNLPEFELRDMPGFMVRHPTQPPWNNWKNCTRDQLLAYAAGCWRAGREDIVKRLLDEHNKRTNIAGLPLCQNTDDNCPGTPKKVEVGGVEIFVETDILAPHHVMFLRICSGDTEAYKDPIGQLALQMDIEVTEKNYKTEKLQLILMAIVCGRLDLYVHVHDNWRENIMHYWDNKSKDKDSKRDQGEIGEAFIKVIECELRRYSGQLPPSTLGLPVETLKALLSSEYFQIFLLGNVTLLPEFINRLAQALSSDIQKIAKEVESYITNSLKNPLNILNIPFMPFNPVAQLINNLFKGTDLTEVYSRLNEIQKGIINLTKMVGDLQKDIYAIPERNAAFEAKLNLENDFEQFGINCQAYYKELAKGNKENVDKLKQDFSKLSEKLLSNIIDYSKLNNSYTYAPIIIACMDIHLTCLVIAEEIPSKIEAILELKYKPWFEKILNDKTSENSLHNKLLSLRDKHNNNKLSIPPLYTIQFKFSKVSSAGFLNTTVHGIVKKFDYSSTQLFDQSKIDSLKPLIDKEIIFEDDFPELISENIVEQSDIDMRLQGTYFDVDLKFETFEVKHKFLPIHVWNWCAKSLNVDSIPFPITTGPAYNTLKTELVDIGESIVRHGAYVYNCQLALEKIEEVIKTLNEQ